MDELVGIILFVSITGAVVVLGVLSLIARFLPPDPAELSSVPTVRARDYVAQRGDGWDDTEAPEPAFERPEPAAFVQRVQALNTGAWSEWDIIRIDTLARLMAAGVGSESTLIPTVYDGQAGVPKVSKGGSAAYTARRDALRAAALSYGWKPPETPPPAPEPRLVLISGGREGSVEL